MSTETALPPGEWSESQRNYLEGFFAGVRERAVVFASLQPVAAPEADQPDETAEERIKREEHPLDAYHRIAENARSGRAPDKEDVFRFKWSGLFFLTPVHEAFMARLRIPGGVVTSHQWRELAAIARELTTGYVQVTTRANLQIRLITMRNAPHVLRRIQAIGLHTRGSGADNIRNLTCNPTAGIDPVELIDCLPFVRELGDHFLAQREFANLPRKFNIAFDGGGLIGSVEDTNDIGVKAVRDGDGVAFRIALGGATGHKAFASDAGIVVSPDDIVDVVIALVRVFIERGDRSDRKRARLKHLLESMPIADFVAAAEARLGRTLRREALAPLVHPSQDLPHSHIGIYPQKQPGLNYIGVRIPVGQLTPGQMTRLAELAEHYGNGEIRLTVWQNLILPGVADGFVGTVTKALHRIGLATTAPRVSGGIIACTGNRFCKFSSTDTKGHALALSRHLEDHVELDEPVNIHFTGCPHSCAQHAMGDIGLLGAKTRDGREAYHVLVGGGFGRNAACGRQLFQAMPFDELRDTLTRLLTVFRDTRHPGESFQQFTLRHDVRALQEMASL